LARQVNEQKSGVAVEPAIAENVEA
jgi:hypothetical protein